MAKDIALEKRVAILERRIYGHIKFYRRFYSHPTGVDFDTSKLNKLLTVPENMTLEERVTRLEEIWDEFQKFKEAATFKK